MLYPLRRFRIHLLRCGRENVLLLGTSKSGVVRFSLDKKLKTNKKPDLKSVFLKKISKEDSGSKIYLEEIQESVDEELIVNTDTQQEVVTPVKPDDISLPIHRTSGRVRKPPQFYYGFHIEEDKISDSTLKKLDEPANYKEAMASLKAAKWKETRKSKLRSMYDNQVWNLVDTTLSLKTV
ncbi:hypothetical protein Tco_0022934 [Tanacetum coccineum]